MRKRDPRPILVVAVILAAAAAGCSPQPSVSPAQVAGCYEPGIGPFLETEMATSSVVSHWVALDSISEEQAPVTVAFEARLPVGYQHPRGTFRGWWEPLGRDSLVVFWDRNGWSLEVRLEWSADGLQGTAIPRLDINDAPPHEPFPVSVRKVPCTDSG